MSALRDFFNLTPIKPSYFESLKMDLEGIILSVKSGNNKYSHLFNKAKGLLKQAEESNKIFSQKKFDDFYQTWSEEVRVLTCQAWKA
jgi:hypothetical protein